MSGDGNGGDNLDRAAELQGAINDAGVARAAAATAPQTHPDFDGEHCVTCDADMPAARLALGRMFCVGCQTKIERKQK